MANTRSLISPSHLSPGEKLPTWRLQAKPLLSSELNAPSLPRYELFNLFTPTPGPLGHNSSVIVFFWENKPGSWLPQNCLLPVFWLVRCSQLWPLIGRCHPEHLSTEHWQLSTNGPTSCMVWCLLSAATINFLFIPPTKGHVSALTILNARNILRHCRVFWGDKQPPPLILNSGSLSGCKVGAIIYKVKTGWVPLDLGEKLLLASDWSAFVMLASDWSKFSDLPFDWPGLGGGHKMVSAGVRL